jgi:hypothetical protein
MFISNRSFSRSWWFDHSRAVVQCSHTAAGHTAQPRWCLSQCLMILLMSSPMSLLFWLSMRCYYTFQAHFHRRIFTIHTSQTSEPLFTQAQPSSFSLFGPRSSSEHSKLLRRPQTYCLQTSIPFSLVLEIPRCLPATSNSF